LRPEAGGIAAVGRHYLYGIRAWGSLHVRRHAQGEGFTLTNDPKARRAELAIREYALRNETLILQVLASSSAWLLLLPGGPEQGVRSLMSTSGTIR
jgi:hypothetical protein